jgi:FAD/FMN-containing dehydrogenase/Fe-S oxidoreductase
MPTLTVAPHLIAALTRAELDLDDNARRLSEYSSDASNYRVRPQVVVSPRDADDVAAVIQVARDLSVPITARGGGTSVAGNAIGSGIVLDFLKHMNRIIEIDPDAATAVVQPGVLLGSLQQAARPHGLRFGPEPSTWARCTIGGMIGNNACGAHALAFGRTADNVHELDVIDGTGRRFRAGDGLDPVPGLDSLVTANLDILRTELGRFGRQISGYSLEHLLPENGRALARALVGTEGTTTIAVEAKMRLVPTPHDPLLVVLGYPDMPSAADAVPTLLAHHPNAIEGMESQLIEVMKSHMRAVPELPAGKGWLMVEVSDRQPGDALARAEAIVRDAGALASRILPTGPEARALWRIREDGAGLAGRTAADRQAWPGLEDAAVPPENLGAYLRDFNVLLGRYDINGLPFGHFGDGCVHVRLDIPLNHDGKTLEAFMEDAASLIASHGGSISGEHGDGRARSTLLPHMYSPRMIELFGAFKALLDPDDVLNPGIIVRPNPIDTALRRPTALPLRAIDGFAFAHDDNDLTSAIHRCVGLGKCRVDNTGTGTFMCPSYIATRDEKDSTRGRARVLQEAVSGVIRPDWNSPEIAESLDLCLSCKACSTDCPAGVDMAALKSEVTYRKYRGRLRPIAHYTLGWMPRWARLATRVSVLANVAISIRPVEKLVLLFGGMDARRSIPRFARQPFRSWWNKRTAVSPVSRKRVVLWADSFSDNFSPEIGRAAVDVLEAAGYQVFVPSRSVCCGLTWITTGQLDGARRKLTELADVMHPFVADGVPIIGLEPSCTAVLRSDLLELLPGDERVAAIAANTYTLAELLSAPEPLGPGDDWARPDLSGVELVVQPHCHHHSVMGFGADQALLTEWGATTKVLAGCCGLAGNFGMERGHYEVSVAVAENALLPALRAASPQTVFLADGLSCRTQAAQLAGASGVHLAELIAAHSR